MDVLPIRVCMGVCNSLASFPGSLDSMIQTRLSCSVCIIESREPGDEASNSSKVVTLTGGLCVILHIVNQVRFSTELLTGSLDN